VYNQMKVVTGILFLAILVYSGLWYTAAFDAEKMTTKKFALWRDAGLLVEHGKIEHGGFPYRITVNIKNLKLSTRARGLQFAADDILLVSHLWTPGHWVAEAHRVKGGLIQGSSQFAAEKLIASYRLHDDGKIVIVVAPDTGKKFTLPRLMGKSGPTVSAWQLFLQYGGTDRPRNSNLYGERFLDFKITGQTPSSQLEIMGGISGPVIKDWASNQLANWRDAGGLLELDAIEFSSASGKTKGSASFTLDERFRPLGSASLIQAGDSKLADIIDGLGLRAQRTRFVSANGPISIMFQNGHVSLDGSKIAELKPLVD